MISQREEHLLIKYLSKEANAMELDELEEWINNSDNEDVLREFVNTHYAITIGMNNSDPNKIKERLLREIRRDKKLFPNKKLYTFFKYAAIAIFFTVIGYFFQEIPIDKVGEENLILREEAITLEMNNGEVRNLSDKGTSQIIDQDGNVLGEQKEGKLVYGKSNKTNIFNLLKVPYGKKFDIFLSDGTHVFLNSGSSLRYPISFSKEATRQVSLEGEAFFEVAQDTDHPFLVGTHELNVKVYGTKFNVSNYSSDNDIDVVLIEGSVALGIKEKVSDDDIQLEPGFKGGFDKTKKIITTEKVDPTVYTAWMDGYLVFRNTPFSTIIKQLERQYNVIIINNNQQLAIEAFNATFRTKEESLSEVMNYFDNIYDIDYQIFNNKIIID